MRLKTLKITQKAFYKSIVSVMCPILNETIYFTSEGYNHLLYEHYGKPRKPAEQFMKLRCLNHVPSVIQNCPKITDTRPVELKIKGKLKKAIHYELTHEVVLGAKIRVIIERIGTGHYKFKSVMPHDEKSKRILATKKHP